MLSDYTLPFVSMVRGRRFDRYLQTLFGDTNIEDLRMPYFCVSSNLTRADMVVHRTGPLWRATRASGSLPAKAELVEGLRNKPVHWLVSVYIAEIRRVQPAGPYHLSGYSAGSLAMTAVTYTAGR